MKVAIVAKAVSHGAELHVSLMGELHLLVHDLEASVVCAAILGLELSALGTHHSVQSD